MEAKNENYVGRHTNKMKRNKNDIIKAETVWRWE
jgi:hypothetical protein